MACTGVLVETDAHAEQLVRLGKSMLHAACRWVGCSEALCAAY